jgi:ABC-type glycerol-3-phosphate transport system substrate-binding protein
MRTTALAVAAAALLAAGCGGSARYVVASHHRGATVPQLESIRELARAFDAHPGVPRLVVLISPT